MDVIKCLNDCGILSFLSLIVASATLYFTIKIPEKIMWAQIYSNLNAEYRSHEFGEAVQGIVDFFVDDCKCDLDAIESEYRNRYDKDSSDLIKRCKNSKSLHYQRRMVAQFYMQLDMCVEKSRAVRRLVITDYGRSETNLIKILYYMDRASYAYNPSYKDIKTKDPLIMTKFEQTALDKKLVHLYKFFKKEIGE